MKHFLLITTLFTFFATQGISQKYFTKTAVVSFESKTPLEKIEAINKSGTCVVDFTTGNVEFAVLIKGFQFEKALMQEHFNENYMESSTFPKANFKGKIEGIQNVKVTKNGKHKVIANGQITIHGVTKPLAQEVNIDIKDGKITAGTNFSVTVADFNIVIPSLVRDNIAKIVNVSISSNLEPLK